MLKINELTIAYQEGIRAIYLVRSYKPGADPYIVNSYPDMLESQVWLGMVITISSRLKKFVTMFILLETEHLPQGLVMVLWHPE